eukprot:g26643.t1
MKLTEIAKQIDALLSVARLFPGQSPVEVEKSVRLLVQQARTSVPVVANRARALCERSATETIDQLLVDVRKMSLADLKKLGKKLQIELAGSKDSIVEDVRVWIDSAGTVAPPTAKEKEERAASQFAAELKPLMASVRGESVDAILGKADAAYKALKVGGFRAFAAELGVPVNGGKAAMKKQFHDFVKRLAVQTNEPGLYGLGCATFTQRPRTVQTAVDDYLKPFLVGKNPLEIEDIWQSSFVSSYWRNGPVLNNAISGVDIALWDILGKVAGLPVYRLLGGKARQAVDTYRHATGDSFEEVEDRVREFIEQGYRHVRAQVAVDGQAVYGTRGANEAARLPENNRPAVFEPRPYARTVPRLFDHLRATVGDEVELLHDVHERVPPAMAIQLARDLEPYRLYFLEDPFAPEDIGYFQHLRPQTTTPIAMGELFNNLNEFLPLISERLIDFIRVHISQIGGLTPAKKLASFCEYFGVRTAWHGPGDVSPIGHAANIHLDLAVTNFGIQEAHAFNQAEEDVFPGCPVLKDGYYHANDKPGFGIDLDEELAAKFPIEDAPPFDLVWGNFRRRDGSIVKPIVMTGSIDEANSLRFEFMTENSTSLIARPARSRMRRIAISAGAAVVGMSLFQNGCAGEKPAVKTLDERRAKGYLEQICRIGRRISGTEGMEKQQKLLADHFRKHGAEVNLQQFDLPHPVTGKPVRFGNLIVSWHPKQTKRILIACHYDTRPFPDQDQRNPRGLFVGANDGASGVALLMEMAHLMKDAKTKYGVDFVFFDGEELVYPDPKRRDWNDMKNYFHGSRHFATMYRDQPPKHQYVAGVVVDMYLNWSIQDTDETLLGTRTTLTTDPQSPFLTNVGIVRVPTTEPLTFNDKNGIRGTFGIPLTFGEIEFSAFLLDQGSDKVIPPNTQMPGLFVGTTVLSDGALGRTVRVYDRDYRASFTSDVWGGEVNIILDTAPPGEGFRIKPLYGARYLSTQEQLTQVGTFNGAGTVPPFTSTIDSDNINNIYGMNLGFQAELVHRWFTVGARPKIMVGANTWRARVTTNTFVSPADPRRSVQIDGTDFAGLAELQVYGKVHVNSSLTLFVSYNLLYATNVIRPHKSIRYNVNTVLGVPVSSAFGNKEVFEGFRVEGLTVGAEFKFN